MLSVVLFSLLAFIQIAISGDECISGQSLSGSDEIKCDDDFSCDGCDSIVLADGKLLNCGGDSSCLNANADIDAIEEFQLECNGEDSCRSDDGTNTFTITCIMVGEETKGIKCGGDSSCRGLTIIIDGCDVEKIECDGDDSCRDADIRLINGAVISSEFVCGGDRSCLDLTCSDSPECP
mmetsp:Transcript_24672/g.21567  ORF Transcript_24672/g.21567 Transcript_24672/m.21567 type:complete len:179 (-) Transcript_24672:88-624(-)